MDSVETAAVQRARAALDVLRPRRKPANDDYLVRALEALCASPHGAVRYDNETARVVAQWREEAAIEDADPDALCLPFGALTNYVQRDLTISDGPHGGYLAGTEASIAAPINRWSLVAQSGATIKPNVRAGEVLASPFADATLGWSDAGATASSPTLAAAVGTAKVGYATVDISRKLRIQSNASEAAAECLLRTAAHGIDSQVLGGSGANGECTGIGLWSGVKTMTGASISFAAITNGKRDASLGGAQSGVWVTTPTVRALLELREMISGGGIPIWANNVMAGWIAVATPDCPASTLIGGYWPACYVLLYGNGIVVDRNPFDPIKFSKGITTVRVCVQMDVLLPLPSAFAVAVSVT
jgi:hypothetical protein